jgi:hypothetical protein
MLLYTRRRSELKLSAFFPYPVITPATFTIHYQEKERMREKDSFPSFSKLDFHLIHSMTFIHDKTNTVCE